MVTIEFDMDEQDKMVNVDVNGTEKEFEELGKISNKVKGCQFDNSHIYPETTYCKTCSVNTIAKSVCM